MFGKGGNCKKSLLYHSRLHLNLIVYSITSLIKIEFASANINSDKANEFTGLLLVFVLTRLYCILN